MPADTNLEKLLATLSPAVRSGRFVFASVDEVPPGLTIESSVVEPEGTSIVVRQQDADTHGITHDYVAGWITLHVHSSLAAVGLTAAVSTALAAADISCNIIAGFHHDHLLVPIDRVDDAMAALTQLT